MSKRNRRIQHNTHFFKFNHSETQTALFQLFTGCSSCSISLLYNILIIFLLFVSGQSTKACELFLKNRAAAVQTAIRQLRIEGATLLYIHKLCNIFFTSLLETAKEFEMDFAGNTGCYSAFVVWSKSAMKMFVDAFSKQVGKESDKQNLGVEFESEVFQIVTWKMC